jgi:type IV pilus assembly protein PilQ
MPYLDALNVIVNAKNLMYEEKEESIVIKQKGKDQPIVETPQEEKLSDDIYADITAREVNISAVFFEADVEKTREIGIDWKFLISNGGKSVGSELLTQSIPPQATVDKIGTPAGFNVNGASNLRAGNWTGDASALFRFFESENLGEIIASPSITVRNRQKGRIQIGSDFSIKQRDFSGNIIDRFYSAGSIIEVVPYVYNKKGIDYILLKLIVERSSFFPSDLSTEIKKTAASSDVLLLNGEETIIGGLYINEENTIRNGIPFLKDLPWWVFGIRYLTGSDETLVRKKEVVILLKADLLQTIEDRYTSRQKKNTLIEDKIKKDLQDIKSKTPDFMEKQRDN